MSLSAQSLGPHYSARPKRLGHVVQVNFKVKNTPLKDTDGNRKFKRILSFLLVDKGRIFFTKLSFEELKLTKLSSRLVDYCI